MTIVNRYDILVIEPVMPGHSRLKDGVASLAYVPAIHVFESAWPLGRGCVGRGHPPPRQARQRLAPHDPLEVRRRRHAPGSAGHHLFRRL